MTLSPRTHLAPKAKNVRHKLHNRSFVDIPPAPRPLDSYTDLSRIRLNHKDMPKNRKLPKSTQKEIRRTRNTSMEGPSLAGMNEAGEDSEMRDQESIVFSEEEKDSQGISDDEKDSEDSHQSEGSDDSEDSCQSEGSDDSDDGNGNDNSDDNNGSDDDNEDDNMTDMDSSNRGDIRQRNSRASRYSRFKGSNSRVSHYVISLFTPLKDIQCLCPKMHKQTCKYHDHPPQHRSKPRRVSEI